MARMMIARRAHLQTTILLTRLCSNTRTNVATKFSSIRDLFTGEVSQQLTSIMLVDKEAMEDMHMVAVQTMVELLHKILSRPLKEDTIRATITTSCHLNSNLSPSLRTIMALKLPRTTIIDPKCSSQVPILSAKTVLINMTPIISKDHSTRCQQM